MVPKGGGGTEKEKKAKKEEKFLLCESIGHWPLQGQCPRSRDGWKGEGRRRKVRFESREVGREWGDNEKGRAIEKRWREGGGKGRRRKVGYGREV